MQSSRIFRVFISSTFSDLKVERNALQQRVFPKLRKLCVQHGCQFQAIDLRWGISEESALDQQAMKICLEEIERCQDLSPRPNFIVLLGDRYGWQPLPYEIPVSEYNSLIKYLDASEVTFLETWYRRDDNAVPPVYDLFPRQGEFEVFKAWRQVEKKLHKILRKGVSMAGLPDDARFKYFSSATEQEIYKGALMGFRAEDHVFCFFRSISDLPYTDISKEFIDFDEETGFDSIAYKCLLDLKKRLYQKLSDNVHEYNDCRWIGGEITTAHTDKLCEDVYQKLSGVISQELKTLRQIDPYLRERTAHDVFALERSRNFVGRAEIQDKILTYVVRNCQYPLVVSGESGSGKSSLLAQVQNQIAIEHPTAIVVSRFIGATPSSSNISSLLESLFRQIAEEYGSGFSIPTDYKELVAEFHEILEVATVEKPLILLLDALDQLSNTENAQGLQWLPTNLPKHVKTIVSVLTPSRCHDQLQKALPENQVLSVGPMPQDEAAPLLDHWLNEKNRRLQQSQLEEVLSKFEQCGLPLYLKIAFEEACQWKSYQATKLSGLNVQDIILNFLENLSEESQHGKILVKHALGYIAAGKNGLTEEEILDLLSQDGDVKEAFWERSPSSPKTDKLPTVVWSRLFLDLQPYLTERAVDQANVMNFFHREFGEVVRNKFLNDETNKKLHKRIAKYFSGQLYLFQSCDEKTPNYRKASELVYQMVHGEMWEDLETILTDFDFPMAKCRAGLVEELISDYQNIRTFLFKDKEKMHIWKAFFREGAHILRRGNENWPAYKILLQIAIEHADNSPVTTVAEKFLAEGKCDWAWLRRELIPQKVQSDPCIAVFEGHDNSVDGVEFMQDGHILSWSSDCTIRIWKEDGSLLKIIERHTDCIQGIQLLSKGRILSWDSLDMYIWSQDGQLLKDLKGHGQAIISVKLLDDGNFLSWALDNTLRLWSGDGQCLAVMSGHENLIRGVEVLPDGCFLSWSDDETLRKWSSEGKPIVTIEESVRKVKYINDWRILIASKTTGKPPLRIVNLNEKKTVELVGHSKAVIGEDFLSDGTIITWSKFGGIFFHSKDGEFLKDYDISLHKKINKVQVLKNDRVLILLEEDENECFYLLNIKNNNYTTFTYKNDHLRNYIINIYGLDDGRIISISSDGSICLWDDDGCLLSVVRVNGSVYDLFMVYSALFVFFRGGDIFCWDGKSDYVINLKGHSGAIQGIKLIADDKFISFSLDHTFRLWSSETLRFDNSINFDNFNSSRILVLDDECMVSWAGDQEAIEWEDEYVKLDLWNKEGKHIGEFFGHENAINGVLQLPDRKILSWSDDCLLRLWSKSGDSLVEFAGHMGPVRGACLLEKNKILSWSDDGTLRVWNNKGQTLHIFHTYGSDFNIKLVLCTLRGRPAENEIDGVTVLPGGRILSWGKSLDDKDTIVLWDQSGEPLIEYVKHEGPILGVLSLADGKLLSWSTDCSLRLWKIDGALLAEMKGHKDYVLGAMVLPDKRILSWGSDGSMRFWDSDGHPLSAFSVHSYCPERVFMIQGGNFFSCTGMDDMCVWSDEGQMISKFKREEIFELDDCTWKTYFGEDRYFSNSAFYCLSSTIFLHVGKYHKSTFLQWQGLSDCEPVRLFSDGRLVAIQKNDQPCVLRTYVGGTRMSIRELEQLVFTS